MDDESVNNQVHTNKLTQLLLLDDIKDEQMFENGDDDQNLFHMCNACKISISDQFYLRVGSKIYHESCLQCAICQIALNKQQTCFLKGLQILCRQDYYKHFGNKCSKCGRHIQPSDWVRRARDHVYHLACFACNTCKRQLSTGEEFALQSSHVLCKTHFIDPNETNDGKDGDTKQGKTKRVRTTFTEEQLQILQANFEVDSNPDGQDLERIAQITGLSKRVIQVWFQNTRARQKKVRDRKPQHEHHLHSHSHHCYIQQETNHRRRNTRSSSSSSSSNKSGDTLTKRTTQIWFQNARARMKKKPCATTSSPPTYATLTNNTNLNLADTLHLSTEQQIDSKTNQHTNHLQWSSSQTSPASSLIYDGENSNDEYSTGYI
ncbi:unnamed protein product [Rotaria magnacalcarata]|uniref:Uncharacterized protein n=2 Tax=Rotaria magnacalcarata TaxID=392030 RepID=A0A816E782_9BILA|nr:unnamed protein product [Rotaria magnacalcarata]CAF1642314.1 unnamed protein product [Rotaria magnacalcarata]CAF2068806.1 unnamed protein product [Rotaria magnacalcarata]CAF4025504.1 unnamed protein product [Rotaria magnacalcarata]CAF4038797.1 unnamed protein product [Rotaria magnacalcarata]